MTTQTTTIQPSTKGMRALIAATAATLALVGGTILWQTRPTSEMTAAVATTISTRSEGIAPLGGLAEQYRDVQQAQAAREAARVTTRGGMAEPYAEQETDMRANVERESRLGGMAELYREQARVNADVGR